MINRLKGWTFQTLQEGSARGLVAADSRRWMRHEFQRMNAGAPLSEFGPTSPGLVFPIGGVGAPKPDLGQTRAGEPVIFTKAEVMLIGIIMHGQAETKKRSTQIRKSQAEPS